MAEERRRSLDSIELIDGLGRAAYRDQFAQRDQQRTRCGTLLAFVGIVWSILEITHLASGSLRTTISSQADAMPSCRSSGTR